MTNPQDKFWKLFFLGLITALLFIGVGLVIMMPHSSLSVESVIPEHTEEVLGFPYVFDEAPPLLPSPSTNPTDYFYRDNLQAELYEISWGADIDWQSTEYIFEGTHAARISFTEPWGGIGVGGWFADITTHESITLVLFVESGVSELYLELYNSHNGIVGRQALSLYMPDGQLVQGHWQRVTVPLASFTPVLPKNTEAFALIAEAPGVIFIDDVRLLP